MATKPASQQTGFVYDYLRRQLMHGQLTPGSRLVEEKWAAQLDVHRGALREALAVLAHEGLLKAGDRGGYFVPEHQPHEIDEVQEVRLVLESGALDIIALKGGLKPLDVARLRDVCAMMRQMLDAGFDFGFAEADRRFHEVLVDAAGNPRLSRVYRHAPLPVAPVPHPDAAERRRNMEQTLADHTELCRLLEAGRTADAAKLLRKHLLVDHETLGPAAGGAP